MENTKRNSDIAELVRDLFDSNGIGTFGIRNDNGADTYNCPECMADTKIEGYCGYVSGAYAVAHNEGCKLQKLYTLVCE